MPLPRVRFTSTKNWNSPLQTRFCSAKASAPSKETVSPAAMQVDSTKAISLIPSAVRLVKTEQSSCTHSGKHSSSSQQPA